MTNEQQLDAQQWAALEAAYPHWTLDDHYVPSVSGPGTMIYRASRGGITVSAYSIAGLRVHLAAHEAGAAKAKSRPRLAVVRDPLGLRRCASCGNAFEHDEQPDGTCAHCGQPFDRAR